MLRGAKLFKSIKMAEKKESWSAKLKRELKEAKEEIAALNVKLDDNVVTQSELKVLKIYKAAFFILAAAAAIGLLILLF